MYSTDNISQEASAETDYQSNEAGRCYLPNTLKMPQSPDGSYTPPSPHQSLVRAVRYASSEEFQEYCSQYDSDLGAFTDDWKYNENGECGNWQEKYTQMHKTDMAALKNYQEGVFPSSIKVAEKPKFISYLCKEVPKNSNRGCGGLADRMGGKFIYSLPLLPCLPLIFNISSL